MDSLQTINSLPTEVILLIFAYVPLSDLLNGVSLTCTEWSEMVRDEDKSYLWCSIFHRTWPLAWKRTKKEMERVGVGTPSKNWRNLFIDKYLEMKKCVSYIKVILIGDGNVGKTTFITRLQRGDGLDNNGGRLKPARTLRIEVYTIILDTNYGKVVLLARDSLGQEKFGGLRDYFYRGVDGVFIMFDMTNRVSFRNAMGSWYRDVNRVCGANVPVILLGNKIDSAEKKLKHSKVLDYSAKKGIKYIEVSALTGFNWLRSIIDMAKKVTKHDDLILMKPPDFSFPSTFA